MNTSNTVGDGVDRSSLLAPGAWLGLLGGGQLGRMFCMAAQSLGYRVAVLDPGSDSPAGSVADLHIAADYDDHVGLTQLADLASAVTTEFENVPASSLAWLADRCRVSPAAGSVAIAQDRLAEKAFVQSCGVAVAPHHAVLAAADLDAAADALFPGILKASRLGYDGKGQVRVRTRAEAQAAFKELGEVPCVLEQMLALDYEISVVLARDFGGASVVYPVAENVHEHGILARSTVPSSSAPAALAEAARQAALTIATRLDYVGVLCVEFFVTRDGELLVNEMAPRPHNSGHYTVDACITSQYEQQVRALCGLPLGDARAHSAAVMVNILGDLWYEGDHYREPDWSQLAAIPNLKLHFYGKHHARHARKMAHFTVLDSDSERAVNIAMEARAAIGITDE